MRCEIGQLRAAGIWVAVGSDDLRLLNEVVAAFEISAPAREGNRGEIIIR
jgi:hypothetical protein